MAMACAKGSRYKHRTFDRTDDVTERNESTTEDKDVPRDAGRLEPIPELLRLIDLAARYPEIGPPLAELAFKIGQPELGERVVRMGLQGGAPGVEYYFVAANAARREGRLEEALRVTVEAVRAFSAADPSTVTPDDGARLLHLVRFGFATLLFDVKDLTAHPEFTAGLREQLPALEGRLGADPFFHVLLAQALWFSDRELSENEWDRAAELGEPEHTWNARGTWYKEAEHDVAKAERAYRQGLEKAPKSALVLHNLAQLLVERAGQPEIDVDTARRLLRDADELLRAALREEGPKGLRRHVHTTRDRLNALRASLPPRPRRAEPAAPPPAEEPEREPPKVGDVVKGRVASLAPYGVFVAIGGGLVGLLHKSELAHEFVDDPAQFVKIGDDLEVKVLDVGRKDAGGRLRIGLSRKALLPPPAVAAAPPPAAAPRRDDRRPRRDDRPPPQQQPPPKGQKFLADGKVSLGEMLLAKLREQKT